MKPHETLKTFQNKHKSCQRLKQFQLLIKADVSGLSCHVKAFDQLNYSEALIVETV